MKFNKFKFTEVNRATCTTLGCNNTPEDNWGTYCAMCRAKMGM